MMDWLSDHITAITQGASIFGGVVGFFLWMRTELINLRSDMSQIKDQQKMLMEGLKQLGTILTQIAVQDARLNMIEKDIDELRHNKGFIN